MSLKRPSPEAIEQASVDIAPTVGAAVAMAGSYDGSPQWAEKVAALSEILARPALTQQQIEHRLSTHIVTMDELFYRLLTSAHDAPGADAKLATIETALKVQSATRKTATALDGIRNPKKPSQFIKNYVDKQLNQMVPTGQTPITQIKEGDRPNVEILDSRATRATAAENSAMEAVGEIDRGEDSARQSHVQPELF
jgi:hypothetical protein